MQLNTTDSRQYEGNFEGETINVGIADVRLIIDRLTDMYADREMAVIREYSCNALDAHIEAGINVPIEVTTPGPLEPFLTIRDFGVGLSLEDIREIYSQYGASTKRNTNTQTGAFGLGCKSGLAYSDQFTVTSTKDGVRIQVVVSRDPSVGITMKVVDTSDTTEANGTTIMIPSRAHNQMEPKAKAFFSRWQKGTVKLNGVEPEFMPGVQWVTDYICLNNDRHQTQSYIVMGGVPYPVTLDVGLGWGKSITAFVPIGACEPKPDREALIDSDDTVNTLQGVKDSFRTGLHTAIQKDIADATSPAEAASKKRDWQNNVGNSNMPPAVKLQYKGKVVPDSYECEFDTIIAAHYGRKMSAHNTYRKGQFLPLPNINGSLWVTGFDYMSFTATVKKKLEKYIEDQGMDLPTNYILTTVDTKPTTTWMENVTFIDWPTIKAIKLPKNVRSPQSGRIPGSYDIFESGDLNEDVPADDINTANDVFWMIGKHWIGRKAADWLNEKHPGCTLVMMRAGREDKFQRVFPGAKCALTAIRHGFEAWVAGIDKDDALAMHMQREADIRLSDLDASLVDDPDIIKAKKVLGRNTDHLDDDISTWAVLGHYYTPDVDSKIENPLVKYPLLPESYYFDRHMRGPKADHIYRYMNSEYAYLKEQN